MSGWTVFLFQLENDETFVLPSATINLNVVMGSDARFPQMRG